MKRYFLVSILMIIIVFLIRCSDSNFQMVGYFKNNKTKFRVFSYYTPVTDSLRILKHARKQMWSERAMTIVFYFNDPNYTPDVTFVGAEFDKKYEPYCIAGYWKYPTDKETFMMWPFKK